MRKITAVGFDMDYTLAQARRPPPPIRAAPVGVREVPAREVASRRVAQYLPETFEQLAYELTLKKLVPMGYPEARGPARRRRQSPQR